MLESVESGGKLSRYSFVGLDYAATATFEATADQLERVRAFVQQHRPASDESGLGGALVAFAYDAARPFAKLAQRTADAPAMPSAYVCVPATWLVFDHLTHSLTVWGSGDDPATIDARLDAHIAKLLASAPRLAQPVRAVGAVQASMDKQTYLDKVATIKQHIYDGDVYQLQIGIRFNAQLEGTAFDLYRALRRRNPSPYMFFVDTPFGQLLGASPEFLVRLEGRKA